MSSSVGTFPSRPSTAFKPPRSDRGDSLYARTAHSQLETGSNAWDNICAESRPYIVIFSPFLSVQSTAKVRPGL